MSDPRVAVLDSRIIPDRTPHYAKLGLQFEAAVTLHNTVVTKHIDLWTAHKASVQSDNVYPSGVYDFVKEIEPFIASDPKWEHVSYQMMNSVMVASHKLFARCKSFPNAMSYLVKPFVDAIRLPFGEDKHGRETGMIRFRSARVAKYNDHIPMRTGTAVVHVANIGIVTVEDRDPPSGYGSDFAVELKHVVLRKDRDGYVLRFIIGPKDIGVDWFEREREDRKGDEL